MGVQSSILKLIGLATMLVLSATNIQAEDSPVVVTVDKAKVFRIEEPASTVIVGNPFIADVSMQDRYTVVVTGKAFGSTNLVILDDTNQPIIEETLLVRATDKHSVTVTRGTSLASYSCSPVCEPTLRLGSDGDKFKELVEQFSQRNELAIQAAGGGN